MMGARGIPRRPAAGEYGAGSMAALGALRLAGLLALTACPPRPAVPTGASAAPAETPRALLLSLQASYSAPVMSQSPIAVALEGGYFAEQGLDVTISAVRL